MNRLLIFGWIMLFILSGCSIVGSSTAKTEAPFAHIAYTVKEVGSAAMKVSERTNSESYAYEVTLYDGETRLEKAEQSTRVVLPYAMFDINYGTKAEEKYNNLTVFFDDVGKLTPVCGRYVRDLEGVELFINESGTYVVKDNSVKLTEQGDYVESATALIARGVMTQDELNNMNTLTWDDLDGYIAKIYNAKSGIISRCGFDKGTRYKAGKSVSLQDTAVVVYNALSAIRAFPEPKEQTKKKVPDYAKTAVSTFEDLKAMTFSSAELKKPANIKKLAQLLGKAYFIFGKSDEENAEITQPSQKSETNGVTAFASVEALENSSEYSIKVNGTPVSCQRNLDLTVARFGVTGKFEVEIAAKHDITGLTISPMTLGIVPEIYKNTAKFTVAGPQKLFLRMGGPGEDIALFAEDMNAPFAKVDSNAKIINVADYKLGTTGKTDITEKLQEILDRASAEKATVYIPDGTYLTRRLKVGNDTSIFFEPSAFLMYKTDFEAAKKLGNTNQTGLLDVFDVSKVHIYGFGGFLGRGTEKKAIAENYCPRNLYMVNSKNVTVEGICSFDAGSWNTHMRECANMVLRDYKVLNDVIIEATDSVDIDSSSNVLIENCFLRGEDDNIVLKTTAFWDDNIKASPTVNVVARNNICYAGAAALKFGTETRALTSQDILYENNYVIRADTSIQITNYNRSYLKNIVFKNNFVEFTNSFTNKQRKDIFIAIDETDESGSGLGANVTIDNVLIDGLFVHTKAYQKNKIVGFDNTRRVKNVVIENYYIAGKKVTPDTFRVETNGFAQFEVN